MSAFWWLALFVLGFSTSVSASGSDASDSSACDANAWRYAVAIYSRTHPRAEAPDLYKFVHQGIMGSEHAVTDTAPASAWMRREVATLTAAPRPNVDSAMIEKLPPDGRFVRVHLRPFLARGGDPALLVHAFVSTANGTPGDTAQFTCAERALSTYEPDRLTQSLIALIGERRHAGFEPAHHSAAFEAAYAPAYRVINASLLESLMAGHRSSGARRD